MVTLNEYLEKALKNENILSTIGSIGKVPGVWGKRLGSFGTVLLNALKEAEIEVIDLKPDGKFENILTVKYNGKQKKIKLDGDSSADKVVKQIIGKK
jgi:hypothetical protein